MSIKSLIQIFILFLIMLIIGGVYFQYFNTRENVVEELNISDVRESQKLKELKKTITNLEEENKELNKKLENNNQITMNIISENIQEKKQQEIEKEKIKEKKVLENNKEIIKADEENIKNLVKDVEYTSIDQKGNTFHLLANSAKSNIEDNDILDLINVRGKIISDIRDTIYIVSDFAQYNSINLNSRFYENVIIDYQDKKITSKNFDINMETDKAIAYNDVIITDPKSIMKAGIVEFDLKTQNININPKNSESEIEIVTDNGIN